MRFHTSQYSRCFIPATTKLWDELPSMIAEATELQKFKLGAIAFYWVWMDCSLPYVPKIFKYLILLS